MARIYYIGDWALQLGPIYAETSFNYAFKGTEMINYGKWLKAALEDGGAHEVVSVPTWDFYNLKPGAWEEILKSYDVIIFSDVEAKNFQLAPGFFDHRQFGTRVLTFPDRVRLTNDAVHAGKVMLFLGGWLSFNGECGKGGWGRTGLREILPVECLEVEDLRESTEGYFAGGWQRSHPVFQGIDPATMPPALGYNRVRARPGCEVLAHWTGPFADEARDPMLAWGRFGKGCTAAYTSDPAPHWGCNFVFWAQYGAFWRNLVAFLLAQRQ
jgi:uncharacterized membrane protein